MKENLVLFLKVLKHSDDTTDTKTTEVDWLWLVVVLHRRASLKPAIKKNTIITKIYKVSKMKFNRL